MKYLSQPDVAEQTIKPIKLIPAPLFSLLICPYRNDIFYRGWQISSVILKLYRNYNANDMEKKFLSYIAFQNFPLDSLICSKNQQLE